MSAPCYSGCSSGTTLYRPQDSSTANVSTTKFNIQYGSGNANGYLVSDTVEFGGFHVNQVSFHLLSIDSFINLELIGLYR